MLSRARWAYVIGWAVIAVAVIGFRAQALLQPLPPAFPEGVVHVAIDPSYAPLAFYAGDEVVGLDVDLAYALGEELGLPVELHLLGVDALYDAVRDRRADVIISALQPERWRLGDVRYSNPYFNAGLVLVGNSGLKSMRDLPGHSLAYEFGSTADAEARAWARRVNPFEPQPYELPTYALDAARLDQADAALVDALSARLYLRDHPDWDVELHEVTVRPFVIATHIDEPGTLVAVNRALDALEESGVLEAIIARWLG